MNLLASLSSQVTKVKVFISVAIGSHFRIVAEGGNVFTFVKKTEAPPLFLVAVREGALPYSRGSKISNVSSPLLGIEIVTKVTKSVSF